MHLMCVATFHITEFVDEPVYLRVTPEISDINHRGVKSLTCASSSRNSIHRAGAVTHCL